MNDFDKEVSTGQRFQFGKNWAKFLSVLDQERIGRAQDSLTELFECADFQGKRFLDIGSGSGLFSLAARRLGARVHSFDYDPQSVACTKELKRRFFPDDPAWTIDRDSVLDREYVQSLGTFEIVYSYGVLHHTGEMWKALHHAQIPVAREGTLYVAIYNDQGLRSRWWRKVKQTYCSGRVGRALVTGTFIPYFILSGLKKDLLKLRNPARRYAEYKKDRGMSMLYDWLDWLGGYPFEVAQPHEIQRFYEDRGFTLTKLKTVRKIGNNQYLFKKAA